MKKSDSEFCDESSSGGVVFSAGIKIIALILVGNYICVVNVRGRTCWYETTKRSLEKYSKKLQALYRTVQEVGMWYLRWRKLGL